jgi:hypothetical protein
VLLDVGSVVGGIALAVVGFLVVIVVCVVILRLLAAILPSYEDRETSRDDPEAGPALTTDAADEAVPAADGLADGGPIDPDADAGASD